MPARTLLLVIASVGLGGVVNAQEPMEAFLAKHCLRCHGPDREEGELRIDRLSRDFNSGADAHRWAELVERVNAGDMPPKEEKQPTQDEIAAFVTSLDSRIREGRASRMAARPAVAHYRLSRKEYQNTVYDLLGVHYDPTKPGELNEDNLWHGYERIGSELSLSSSHVSRYYRAAEQVLDRAFPTEPLRTKKVRKTAAELRYRHDNNGKYQHEYLDRLGIKRPLRFLIYPGLTRVEEAVDLAFTSEWFGKSGKPQSGLYRIRLQASGIRPLGGQFAHLRVGRKSSSDQIDGLIEFDVTAPEDKPAVYEFQVPLEMPTKLWFDVVATEGINPDGNGGAFTYAIGLRKNYIFTHSSETRLLNPTAPQMFDDKGNGIFSSVILDWIEVEGPLESEAEKSRRAGLIPPDNAAPDMVADHLQRFAERAWRRSVNKDELVDYLKAYRSEREAGEKLVDAYRVAMHGVLTSRHFIYLVEGDAGKPRDLLTDAELASRLSYFLWSSMPDDALLASAKRGELSGSGLKQEVDRMLADSKINRLIEDFPRQWMRLNSLGMFAPDKGLYPTYDAWLETSMRNEPIEFFREMFRTNLSIDNFIDSDWTMANARLSDFYGLPEPQSVGFERTALKPENRRGGLLTMGAVLGSTSDGTRHRPVHRGVWVSETIFNKTPPPPPANVDPIEPTPPKSPKVTIRQKLAVHAQNANCASCHQGIDPLGFAFEQYDAIGQWRTRERVGGGTGEDPLVDPSGTMPDGRPYAGAGQFKKLMLEDRDRFARAFIEHLCTYGLRRVLTVDDANDIRTIVAEVKKQNYQLKDIVRVVALSDLMRKR